MDQLKPEAFFDLADQRAAGLFEGLEYVWEALDRIKSFIRENIKPNVKELRREGDFIRTTRILFEGRVISEGFELKSGSPAKGKFEVWHNGVRLEEAAVVYAGAAIMDDNVEIGPGVIVEPGALIKGPTIIGPFTEVRQGAYIRGACLVGTGCVVGHATEMKNSVMLDGAKAGHFAYLGDSILGRDVNLGAGTKMANLKIMPWPMRVKVGDQYFEVDRRKFGAILGDATETGCNSVTSPATVMSRSCMVAPNVTVHSGYYPPNEFVKAPYPKTIDGSKARKK